MKQNHTTKQSEDITNIEQVIDKYIGLKQYYTFSEDKQKFFQKVFNPVEWSSEYIGWTARDYQKEFFDNLLLRKNIVLRYGRRMGKSDSMIIATIYYATTQINIDINKGSYKILIVCPFDDQVSEFFDRFKVLINKSPKLFGSVDFFHHKAIFRNGTIVQGKSAGTKSNTGAASIRGKGADVIILDECDYMSDKEINNILQLRKEGFHRIKTIAASTPTGDRKLFYRWCTENNKIGWYHIHRDTLTYDKSINEVNPDNALGLTFLQEMQMELSALEFLHEVQAEFGEAQRGLFAKKYIDQAINLGIDYEWKYKGPDEPRKGPRILSVDWDKAAASTNIIIMEYNKRVRKFFLLVREEIPSHEFTYTMAVSKVISMNELYNPDKLYVDRGYGEKQIEDFRSYGMEHPDSGLKDKVVPISFSQKLEMRDPYTRLKVKKDIKPYMVNNAVNAFEKGAVVLEPSDHKVVRQLEGFHIKHISSQGRPTYSDQDEHIVDCICLALLGFQKEFGKYFMEATYVNVVGIYEQLHKIPDTTKRNLQNPSNLISGNNVFKSNNTKHTVNVNIASASFRSNVKKFSRRIF